LAAPGHQEQDQEESSVQEQALHQSECTRRRCATQPASARPASSSSHLSGCRPAPMEKRGSAAAGAAGAATRIGVSLTASAGIAAIGPFTVRRNTSTNE